MNQRKFFILMLSMFYVIHVIEIILFRWGLFFDLFFSDYPVHSIQRSLFSTFLLISISYILLYKTVNFVFSQNLSKKFSIILSIIIPLILLGVSLLDIITKGINFTNYVWPLILLSYPIFCILFIFLACPGFVNTIGAKIKYFLFICLSILMIFFSGQSVNMTSYGENGNGTYLIGESFDYYNIRLINLCIIDTSKKNELNSCGESIYRNQSDSVRIGSYTNKFLFRDYYLTKDLKLTVLRGFGIAFNLPDDKKYLLKY